MRGGGRRESTLGSRPLYRRLNRQRSQPRSGESESSRQSWRSIAGRPSCRRRRPQRRRTYAAIQVMAAEGLPIEVACRVLGVSVSGYYEWLNRPPSASALRHTWLKRCTAGNRRPAPVYHFAALPPRWQRLRQGGESTPSAGHTPDGCRKMHSRASVLHVCLIYLSYCVCLATRSQRAAALFRCNCEKERIPCVEPNRPTGRGQSSSLMNARAC
jgi:hypothetical protein